VFQLHRPRLALKRGALLAAANWQVALIQASADSLFKAIVAVPLVGGVAIVALVVGAEPSALLSLEARELAATVASLLLSRPIVVAAFLTALAVAAAGGSVLVFLVKGGAVTVLVEADAHAGPIEVSPILPATLAENGRFTAESFIDAAQTLFSRYARLGAGLFTVYAVSGLVYLGAVFGRGGPGEGLGGAILVTVAFVSWITLVNFVYLLIQVAIAAEACGLALAVRRVGGFLRHSGRDVLGVFLVVLIVVVFATAASLVVTAGLGLIGWVPFVGLAVWPLQLLAWLLRVIVFQYIALSSVGAYLTLYRGFMRESPAGRPEPVYPVLTAAGPGGGAGQA
jgi:hypothetical protein